MKKISSEDFRALFDPIFAEVPKEELNYLIQASEQVEIKTDDFLFKQGEKADHMSFILSGKLHIYTLQQGKMRQIFELQAGDITGLLPYSRLVEAQANGRALEDCQVLSFHRKDMPELIRNNYKLTEALVHHMSSRIREFTTFQQQNEKMMALGKLSAGLAHELNNPASAIVRSSKELQRHLAQQPESFKRVVSIRMSAEEIDEVNRLLFDKLKSVDRPKLSLMQAQMLEDDLLDCLEDHGVQSADEIAENLVEFGFSCPEVEQIFEATSRDHFAPVMHWINNNLITEKMVRDIEEAASRIAKLVSSVKTFTHMDRSPERMQADIHLGLQNTLTMLNHKIKQGSVEITTEFSENLPQPKVFVSELNQVWTNLIDNAIDAMKETESPSLLLKTSEDKGFVRIEITDNGPGIPEEVQNKIFNPFFTTKAIGEGTGLGLDIARKIIQQHNGTLKLLESRSGKTSFEVCLPLEQAS